MYPFNAKLFKLANNLFDLSAPPIRKYKEQKLKEFVKQNANLDKQGSQGWHEIRKDTIGGSEISVIDGKNKYNNVEKLIARKVGFTKFEGNIACRWGNLFEPITNRLTEMLLNTNISETGSLPGVIPQQRYSPDGLGVATLNCSKIINNRLVETREHCIILFEYKAPFTTVPSGIIPTHYLPQVLAGLCSIPLASFALFVNNMYRKCSFADLLTDNYDIDFHKNDAKKNIVGRPLAFGMIVFYQTAAQHAAFCKKYEDCLKQDDYMMYDTDSDCEVDMTQLYNINNAKIQSYENYELYQFINEVFISGTTPMDLGNAFYRNFNDILILLENNLITAHYCEPHIMKKYDNNPFLAAQKIRKGSNPNKKICEYENIIDNGLDGKKIFSYLPWKLVKSDIVYQERQPNYVKNLEPKIVDVVDKIKKIQSCNSAREKEKEFKKIYPNTKILKNAGLDTDYLRSMLPRFQ